MALQKRPIKSLYALQYASHHITIFILAVYKIEKIQDTTQKEAKKKLTDKNLSGRKLSEYRTREAFLTEYDQSGHL